MGKRAAAVAETRRRIVEATLELHTTKGVAATSWEDIAERAGVGVGTVYRHFPSLDELVPACGAVAAEIVALPDAAAVEAAFAGAGDRAATLVREVFAIYERGAAALWATRREPHVHPRLRQDAEALDAALDRLIDTAAIGGDRRVVRGLLDLATWDALRRQGLEPQETVAAVSDMVRRAADG
jgi:AcrR family transcriptional regulator